MNKVEIEFEPGGRTVMKIFLMAVEFVLSYVRNSLFIMSAMMIFLILVIIQIFFQDESDMNLIGQIVLTLENIPVIDGYISVEEEAHFDGNDISNFFLRLSFFFTVVTEIIYHIRRYILKKEILEMSWASLKKRALFVCIGLTIMFAAAFAYVASQTKDMSGGVFIFVLFWIIAVASTLGYLLFDFLIKKLRRVKI